MEALFILIGLALLAAPAVLIWLAFSHVALRRSVTDLSNEVARLKERQLTPLAPVVERTEAKRPAPAPTQTVKPLLVDKLVPSTKSSTDVAPKPATTPPKSYVFEASNIDRMLDWIKENWFIAVAAISLAMAGIFLVQYGIENGVLSPRNRVLCALVFGAGLIGFGEWIRRKGSDETGTTAFLPSAFAGAGVVTLFAAILSAQQMYGLIGKETAFIALVGLAALSIVLGWLYGAFLTVIGLVGAVAAPFITSDGTSENIDWLFYYFALIAVIGLGVDAMKRSAWVSSLGLIIPYVGASLIWLVSGSEHFIAFAALIAVAATCIPTVQIRPAFNGAMTSARFTLQGRDWPEFPTRLAAAGILSLTVVAILISTSSATGFWLALGILALTLALLGYWLTRTTTLDDLAIPVALAILAIIGLHGFLNLGVAFAFTTPLNLDLGETAPKTATWLVSFGLGISALAGWRSLRDTRHSLFWAAGAAIFAPATIGLLTLYWEPFTHMSPVQWASHAIAVAILMTVFAEQTLRVLTHSDETTGRLQTSLFALAALNMVAFAMSIVLTETALTLGFAGIAASAAWLDRRFNIRPVSWFVQLGIVVCSYRLVADPGLLWAIDAPLIEVLIGLLGTIALIAVAWFLLQPRERTGAIIVAESANWSLLGIFICVLLFRTFDDNDILSHWSLSLFGIVWLISAVTQLYRTKAGGFLKPVRIGLGAIFGVLGLLFLTLAMSLGNPLYNGLVVGPPIVDSLLVAYLLPAAILGGIAWYFDHFEGWLRIGLGTIAGVAATLYGGLEIRRLWQGNDLTAYGVVEGELYSYTIAMLLAGSVTLGLALMKKSTTLQRAAFAIIGLTIAKVFLIDMSGLEGLTRVLSFLALGLVLAGLALLNRWVSNALEEA